MKTKGWNWIFMELQYLNLIFITLYPVIIVFIHSLIHAMSIFTHSYSGLLGGSGTSHHGLSPTGKQHARQTAGGKRST